MTEILDYLEHSSDAVAPVFQIFRVAKFFYQLSRPSPPRLEIRLAVDEFRQELSLHRQSVHRLVLAVEAHRASVLTQLDYLRADRDFIACQIQLAHEIAENRSYDADIRRRGVNTVLDLQSLLMQHMKRSLMANDSTPILTVLR